MNPIKRFVSLIAMVLFLFSCTERFPVAPEIQHESSNISNMEKSGQQLTVMTRNIYVGADVDVILGAENPEDIPLLVTQAFQTMMATNFPERAVALAGEVFESRPHLIGLQEVSLLRTQIPGDAVVGGTIPAEDVLMNYLDIFQSALQGYGLSYQVVGIVENSDIEMPMVTGFNDGVPEFGDVRLTDYDVVLARRDVKIKNVKTGNYNAKLSIPEIGIEIPRGYVRCTVKIKNKKYEFVNTHLEPADYGGYPLDVQISQAKELMSMLAPVKIPVILVGDFNSAAPVGETYNILTGTYKYVDVWIQNELMANPNGFTFGHDADLLNPTQKFWERIDYIFVRDGKPFHKRTQLSGVEAFVVGDEVADKTPSGLWPSDHGGVVASLQFSSGKKLAHNGKSSGKNH